MIEVAGGILLAIGAVLFVLWVARNAGGLFGAFCTLAVLAMIVSAFAGT